MSYWDNEDYAPSDWWAQEEANAGPEAPSDWFVTEEANAGPIAPSDWFITEEAKAGPEASFQDVQASYPAAFTNTSGSSSSATKAAATGIKALPSAIKSAINSAGNSDWMDLLKMMLVMNQLKEGKHIGGYQGGIDMNKKAIRTAIPQKERAYGEGAKGQAYFTPVTYAAEGGVMGLAAGGSTKKPRYLDGVTDGMADKIDTDIDGKQAAKLSHGEFVIPADVVSHLGNGNSTAGAKVLYGMMDRVRKARTGTKKQGKRIDPKKFTPGGIAGYAEGGAIAFPTGGEVPVADPIDSGTSRESNLSSWAGPYVTNYLAEGQALANAPIETYTGALTAGTSPLQTKAFTGLESTGSYQPTEFGNAYTAPAAYAPTTFTNQYAAPTPYAAAQFNTGLGDVGSVGSYMSQYMTGVTDEQSKEARRQAEIDRLKMSGRMTQAGAFGGSRHALMEAENSRNLQGNLSNIYATGLQSAYDKALAQRLSESEKSLAAQRDTEASRQFGATQGMTAAEKAASYGQAAERDTESSRQFGSTQGMTAADTSAKYGLEGLKATEASRQFGANQDLDVLGAQLDAGGKQRAIESEALAAQKANWEAQQARPYKNVQFLQSLIEGLPVSTSSSSANSSSYEDLMKAMADIFGLSGSAATTTTP